MAWYEDQSLSAALARRPKNVAELHATAGGFAGFCAWAAETADQDYYAYYALPALRLYNAAGDAAPADVVSTTKQAIAPEGWTGGARDIIAGAAAKVITDPSVDWTTLEGAALAGALDAQITGAETEQQFQEMLLTTAWGVLAEHDDWVKHFVASYRAMQQPGTVETWVKVFITAGSQIVKPPRWLSVEDFVGWIQAYGGDDLTADLQELAEPILQALRDRDAAIYEMDAAAEAEAKSRIRQQSKVLFKGTSAAELSVMLDDESVPDRRMVVLTFAGSFDPDRIAAENKQMLATALDAAGKSCRYTQCGTAVMLEVPSDNVRFAALRWGNGLSTGNAPNATVGTITRKSRRIGSDYLKVDPVAGGTEAAFKAAMRAAGTSKDIHYG